jgi:hypothetical protein
MGARQDATYTTQEGGLTRRYAYMAAALSFLAQSIHLWVLPEHYLMWDTAGYFFLFVAACQGALGVSLLFGAGRWTLRLGIILNLLVIFVWAFTRTVGIPAWVGAFMREPVGALDLAATVVEVVLVLLLAKLKRDLLPKRRYVAWRWMRRRIRVSLRMEGEQDA